MNQEPTDKNEKELIYTKILRGELTIEDALKIDCQITKDTIASWQKQYLIASSEKNVLEDAVEPVWRFFLSGWRKFIAIPTLILSILLPGAVSIYDSWTKLLQFFTPYFVAKSVEMEATELDVCNEWVARVGSFETRQDAIRERQELKDAMQRSGEWMWMDDVHIARDPESEGRFVLVIDMYSGTSDEKRVSKEVERLRKPSDRSSENTIGNKMLAAKAYLYHRILFEETYGSVLNKCNHPDQELKNA